MRKTLYVISQELFVTFLRPSYLILAFGVPVFAVIIIGGIEIFQSRRATSNATTPSSSQSAWQIETEGYVDQSGLIQIIPEDIPSDYLRPYSNEAQAQQALAAADIAAYYIIPPDYIDLIIYRNSNLLYSLDVFRILKL